MSRSDVSFAPLRVHSAMSPAPVRMATAAGPLPPPAPDEELGPGDDDAAEPPPEPVPAGDPAPKPALLGVGWAPDPAAIWRRMAVPPASSASVAMNVTRSNPA